MKIDLCEEDFLEEADPHVVDKRVAMTPWLLGGEEW